MTICACGTAMNVVGKVTVSSPSVGGEFDAPIHECPNCGRQVTDLIIIDGKGLKCFDCGLGYGSPAWMDALVSDDVWKAISPNRDESGILCISCIARRCHQAGLENVPVAIVSGVLVPGRVVDRQPIRVEEMQR